MGGKSSKQEPSKRNSKSFLSFRRSSQRSIMQTKKRELNSIRNEIKKFNGVFEDTEYEEIKARLDKVNSDLDNMNEVLKDKHQKHYDDIVKYLYEVFEQLEDKAKENGESNEAKSALQSQTELQRSEDVEYTEDDQSSPELDERKKIDLKIRKVDLTQLPALPVAGTTYNSRQEKSEDNTNDSLTSLEESSPNFRRDSTRESKVKFGVQVMPILAPSHSDIKQKGIRASVQLLDNNTRLSMDDAIPPTISSTSSHVEDEHKPKPPRRKKPSEEIEEIIAIIAETENEIFKFKSKEIDQTYTNIKKALNANLKKIENVVIVDNPVLKQEQKLGANRIRDLLAMLEKKLKKNSCSTIVDDDEDSEQETHQSANPVVLHQIEEIGGCVDEIEDEIRKYKNTQIDETYIMLENSLLKNLSYLENIDRDENPILKQEIKIATKRINTLLQHLEQKVTQTNTGQNINENHLIRPPKEHYEYANEDLFKEIDSTGSYIDEIEKEINNFHNKEINEVYISLKNALIINLIKLENIETTGNPVLQQEQKAGTNRIHNLMETLENKIKTNAASSYDSDSSDDFHSLSLVSSQATDKNMKPSLSTPL